MYSRRWNWTASARWCSACCPRRRTSGRPSRGPPALPPPPPPPRRAARETASHERTPGLSAGVVVPGPGDRAAADAHGAAGGAGGPELCDPAGDDDRDVRPRGGGAVVVPAAGSGPGPDGPAVWGLGEPVHHRAQRLGAGDRVPVRGGGAGAGDPAEPADGGGALDLGRGDLGDRGDGLPDGAELLRPHDHLAGLRAARGAADVGVPDGGDSAGDVVRAAADGAPAGAAGAAAAAHTPLSRSARVRPLMQSWMRWAPESFSGAKVWQRAWTRSPAARAAVMPA